METALNHYLAMDTFWTPAGNTATNKDLKAEINSLKQTVNSLKIKAKDGNKDGRKKEKVCFDCGEKNQIKGHDGCKHKGEKLFLPEKFKKRSRERNSTTTQAANTSTTQPTPSVTPSAQENWPVSDEKTENGKQKVLCRKCYDKFAKRLGRW